VTVISHAENFPTPKYCRDCVLRRFGRFTMCCTIYSSGTFGLMSSLVYSPKVPFWSARPNPQFSRNGALFASRPVFSIFGPRRHRRCPFAPFLAFRFTRHIYLIVASGFFLFSDLRSDKTLARSPSLPSFLLQDRVSASRMPTGNSRTPCTPRH